MNVQNKQMTEFVMYRIQIKMDYKNIKQMSTTEILSRIHTDLKKQKSLESYLPDLVKSLNSQKQMVFSNMNAKQKMTQLQYLIQSQLKNIQTSLATQKIDLQAEDQPVQSLIDEEEPQELQDDMGQQQAEQMGGEQIQHDQQEENEEENENEEEEEFEQPDYTKGKKAKHDQNQMVDENAQDQGQQLDEEDGQDQNEEDLQENDQQPFDKENDVGLYGQELNSNDQDIENYENQFDEEEYKEFEKQFGQNQPKNNKKSKAKPQQDQNQQDNSDDHVEDNFDHFRQIQLDNQKIQIQTLPKTELDNQIDRLQGKIITKKQWAMKGQIKARQRPTNSLLEYDLQFSSGIKYSHEITEQRNTELQELIKKRILTDMFDDRTRFVNASHIREHFGSMKEVSRQKSKMGLGEVYESQFKNFLGIGDNKNDKLKTQIMDSFKELNYYLDSLSNFSFVPKPSKDNTKKGQSEAIIVEEKVPLTLWNGQKQMQKDNKHRFESQKQVDNQAKRLKNKRIARQRTKQQMKKKLNKKIEYGGITKFEAQAKLKAQMNNKPLKIDGVNMKYNKSASFFKNITQNKGGKPNPDISKMKI